MSCAGATGVSDMAAQLFGELDEKAQSLWFSDVPDPCVCFAVWLRCLSRCLSWSGLLKHVSHDSL